MQQRDAGPHGELSFGEAVGERAQVLDAERGRDGGVVDGKADFFPGFAAGYLICWGGIDSQPRGENKCRERYWPEYMVTRLDCLLCLPETRRDLVRAITRQPLVSAN